MSLDYNSVSPNKYSGNTASYAEFLEQLVNTLSILNDEFGLIILLNKKGCHSSLNL
jgi:hypothetical protein